MLKSLEIKNFRALADFKVNKLGRVNLIVGKNNSGKSTILEALRIYAGGAHSDLLREIAGLHNEAVQVNELANGFDEPLPFEGFFPGRRFPDTGTSILIGEVDRADTTLQIKYRQMITEEVSSTDDDGLPIKRLIRRFLEEDDNVGIFDGEVEPVLAVTKGGRETIPIRVLSRPGARRIETAASLIPCAIVPTRFVSFEELADIWDKVGLTSNKENVSNALRIIAPDFQELMFINSDNWTVSPMARRVKERTAIVSLKNEPRPVPINSMGDGMARVLQLILKMFAAKGGILLIDEFDNGLHYSVQEKVWQMMFELAHQLDIQIFATTHSWDCIESFAQVAREREAGDGILFRVGRSIRTSDHGKITATVFDGQQLFDLTQADMEVR
jgi:predicted ATPase